VKILFDHQIFSEQQYGGISRVYSQLFQQFDKINEIEYELSIILSNNHYLSQFNNLKHYKFSPNYKFKGRRKIIEYINEKKCIKAIKKMEYDIFHPTYFDPYFLNYINDKPYVLTIHDMVYEVLPQYVSQNIKDSRNKKLTSQNAQKIISISHSTKKDIVKVLGIAPEKIDVIHHGYSVGNRKKLQRNLFLPDKYILFIGKRSGYKNFITLISAITPILKNQNDIFLVCVGGGNFSHDEINHMEDLDIRNKVILRNAVDEKDLMIYYKSSILMVYPSLYEGFGLPILEAFANSTPVALSNSSSLPEVADDAAVYFDPLDPDSIRDAIQKLINDEYYRKRLIEAGEKRLTKFSWEQTALKTIDTYKRIL